MAKSSKPKKPKKAGKPESAKRWINDPPPDDRRAQCKVIAHNVESAVRHSSECFVCGAKDETETGTETQYVRDLYTEGWRVICSEQFATIGLMCPECVKTPDEARGT